MTARKPKAAAEQPPYSYSVAINRDEAMIALANAAKAHAEASRAHAEALSSIAMAIGMSGQAKG